MKDLKIAKHGSKPYHKPELIVIRLKETKQTKINNPVEGSKRTGGPERIDGGGRFRGPGVIGPS